jgi:hypothetical protein
VASLWSKVLGVMVFVMVFIFGQKLADMIFPNSTATPTATTTTGTSTNPVMRFL